MEAGSAVTSADYNGSREAYGPQKDGAMSNLFPTVFQGPSIVPST